MDPRATLNRIVNALHDEDIQEATHAAEDYLIWRENGGMDARPDNVLTTDAWITLCSLIVDAHNVLEKYGDI